MRAGTSATNNFFFQAEDGIRDPLVTGVQTCALPILPDVDRIGEAFGIGSPVALDDDAVEAEEYSAIGFSWVHFAGERAECVTRQEIAELRPYRSEERRVGKECKYWMLWDT